MKNAKFTDRDAHFSQAHPADGLVPFSRRGFLGAGLVGMGTTLGAGAGFIQNTGQVLAAQTALDIAQKHPNRKLVVIELFGGNDGLNTVVPFRNEDYYKARPTLNIPADKVLRLDDELGFHPEFKGMERLYKEGKVAIINGVSYPDAIRSHFKAMEVMRSARPGVLHSKYGWLGQFADAYQPNRTQPDFMVNVQKEQNLAVTGRVHSPVVFYDAAAFKRDAAAVEESALSDLSPSVAKMSRSVKLDMVRKIAAGVTDVAADVREAVAQYRSDVDYGAESAQGSTIFGEPAATLSHDLKKVAACLEGNLQTRVYYVNYTGGWDTHRRQGAIEGPHAALLGYTADAVLGFMNDLERMNQADDVMILVMTEFGRRVKENGQPNNGTDHGMAGPWFVVGKHVKGGTYFEYPSLTDLYRGDLKMRVDFRSVYTTMLKDWLGFEGDFMPILNGHFPTVPIFV